MQDFEYLFSLSGEISPVEKSLQESSDSLENRFMKFIGFRRHHLGFVCNHKANCCGSHFAPWRLHSRLPNNRLCRPF